MRVSSIVIYPKNRLNNIQDMRSKLKAWNFKVTANVTERGCGRLIRVEGWRSKGVLMTEVNTSGRTNAKKIIYVKFNYQ